MFLERSQTLDNGRDEDVGFDPDPLRSPGRPGTSRRRGHAICRVEESSDIVVMEEASDIVGTGYTASGLRFPLLVRRASLAWRHCP